MRPGRKPKKRKRKKKVGEANVSKCWRGKFFSNGFEKRLVGAKGKGVAMISAATFRSNEHREWRAFNFRGEIYGTVGEN